MKTLLITRPREDAGESARMLEAKGFRCMCEPMLEIEPVEGSGIALAKALGRRPQALLATSRHALKYLSPPPCSLPVFIVGKTGADYAAKLGFTQVTAAGDNAQALMDAIRRRLQPQDAPLLYLRGEHISADIARELKEEGYVVESVTLYRAHAACQFSAPVQKAIETGGIDAVLFFSQRSAEIYAKLVRDSALTRPHLSIAALCMSAAIALKAGAIEWQSVHVAAQPNQQSMTALTDALSEG